MPYKTNQKLHRGFMLSVVGQIAPVACTYFLLRYSILYFDVSVIRCHFTFTQVWERMRFLTEEMMMKKKQLDARIRNQIALNIEKKLASQYK